MKRYNLSLDAQNDITTLKAYYALRCDAAMTRRIMAEFTKAFHAIAATPGIGHKREDLTPAAVKFWQVFSYLIIYDPASQPVDIVRVMHASQDIKTLLHKQLPRA